MLKADCKKKNSSYALLSFNRSSMRDKLPQDVYFALLKTIEKNEPLNPKLANAIAHGMKEWAIELGATHYTHWFQPLTGFTAEKHDSFLTIDLDGDVFERFSGNQLIMSEPDASSFPSGGMRSTFEARGYTAWDPSSPAFILISGTDATLCIPSLFFSYYGEALDEKTPLLRSCEALSKAAVNLLHLLGKTEITHVDPMVGAEQEFFLVDYELFKQRPDLLFCGRTLIGMQPPKGQQLEDHYFGAIPQQVMEFLETLENQATLLGIPIKTRHNEVAPQQFEVACLHEHANIACDHNLLLMELMRRSAVEHGLKLLLHEKPFAGVNGSGKHNNWSLRDSAGNNLLDPGSEPKANLQFLLFLVAVVKAVHDHADLFKASVASAGNDHRLGACEAPPSIISVFLGKQLDEILSKIEQDEKHYQSEANFVDLGLSRLPRILIDNTDRNRTSPFAFTGNKFEFRAVPSSIPLGFPNTVLNLAVADSINQICTLLETNLQTADSEQTAIMQTIKHFISESKPIRYEGDNYISSWQEEACERKLNNSSNAPSALLALISESTSSLFDKYSVLTHTELEARYRIKLDQYIKQLSIEANTLLHLIRGYLIPSALSYLHLHAVPETCSDSVKACYKSVDSVLVNLIAQTEKLEDDLVQISTFDNDVQQADYFASSITSHMLSCRTFCDVLELKLGKKLYPMPSYHDLLFSFIK
ncbi:MAG: glutamine synthetase type III [Candidatus Cloacimonetes bacterium HGW-Cloacimonetes-3]|jgi:glutamine synthetase|nr:MAG: glutamine synthetase type III [Candidatus Cloacimonetes bacterium HGW-Cloacimonetes-3]